MSCKAHPRTTIRSEEQLSTDTDLRTRFRHGLSDAIKDALIAQENDKVDTYEKLITTATRLDTAMRLREAERQFDKGKAAVGLPMLYGGSSYSSTGTNMSAFADPNAMMIDASRFANATPASNATERNCQFNEMFKGKCNRCGSSQHNSFNGKDLHAHDICKWCNKVGHWESACKQKFLGRPRVIAATDVTAPVSPSPAPSSTVPAPQAVNASASIVDLDALQAQVMQVTAQMQALKTAGF